MIPAWCSQAWWTETNAAWVEAISLIAIFLIELILAFFTLQEHRDSRIERRESRLERRQAEIARQRNEVTCGGTTSILRSLTEEQLCTHLWAGNFRHGGFAFEKGLYG